jgi:hypothetical protein
MNWEAIGAVGEIGGAVGVVLTLIYLAGQLRQNTNALRSASYEHWNSVSTAYSEILAKYRAELSEIEQKASLSELSPEQTKMLEAVAILGFNQAQTAFLQHRAGTLDEDVFESRIMQFQAFMEANPLLTQLWKVGLREVQTPQFTEYIENRISILKP